MGGATDSVTQHVTISLRGSLGAAHSPLQACGDLSE